MAKSFQYQFKGRGWWDNLSGERVIRDGAEALNCTVTIDRIGAVKISGGIRFTYRVNVETGDGFLLSLQLPQARTLISRLAS